MKYFFIIFLSSVCTMLFGCSSNTSSHPQFWTVISHATTTWISENHSFNASSNQLLQWDIGSWTSISWVKYTILISWNKLIYEWFFSISIPKYLLSREYTNNGMERLSFTDVTKEKYLTLTTTAVDWWRIGQNDKDRCALDRYDEGVISNKTIEKVIQGKNIYITNLIFYVPAAPEIDITERKRAESDLCFVDNNVIYIMSVWGYDNAYIQRILNSLHFGD